MSVNHIELPNELTEDLINALLARACLGLESRIIKEEDFTRLSNVVDFNHWQLRYSPTTTKHLDGLFKAKPLSYEAKSVISTMKGNLFKEENELTDMACLSDPETVRKYIRIISSLCPHACKYQIQLAFHTLEFYRVVFNRYRGELTGKDYRDTLWNQYLSHVMNHFQDITYRLSTLEIRDTFNLTTALSKEQFLIRNNYYRNK